MILNFVCNLPVLFKKGDLFALGRFLFSALYRATYGEDKK